MLDIQLASVLLLVAFSTATSRLSSADRIGFDPLGSNTSSTGFQGWLKDEECYTAYQSGDRIVESDCRQSIQVLYNASGVDATRIWGLDHPWDHWQAYGSECGVYLRPIIPYKTKNYFSLREVADNANYIVGRCNRIGYGGYARMMNRQFIVEVRASKLYTLTGGSRSSNTSLQEPVRPPLSSVSSSATNLTDLVGLVDADSAILLNKTENLECRGIPSTYPVNENTCSMPLIGLERLSRQWGSEPQTWTVRGSFKLIRAWATPPRAQKPCVVALRGGYREESQDTFTYAEILEKTKLVLEVCNGTAGKATIGGNRIFQLVVSRDVWIHSDNGGGVNHAPELPETRISTSTTLTVTPTSSNTATVPTDVEQKISVMKKASSLTLTSDQLALNYLCISKSGETSDENLSAPTCSASLKLLSASLNGPSAQPFGPNFQPRSWQAPGSQCAIYLLASEAVDASTFSMPDVTNAAQTVLSKCGEVGKGGIARVGGTSSGFFVGVVAPSEASSEIIVSTTNQVPAGRGQIPAGSSASLLSINTGSPVLPDGDLNIVTTLPPPSVAQSLVSSEAPVQSADRGDTS